MAEGEKKQTSIWENIKIAILVLVFGIAFVFLGNFAIIVSSEASVAFIEFLLANRPIAYFLGGALLVLMWKAWDDIRLRW